MRLGIRVNSASVLAIASGVVAEARAMIRGSLPAGITASPGAASRKANRSSEDRGPAFQVESSTITPPTR
ncbi:Uncharacterised protein [Mycobacteroides abscessus subsp. abscessus]|nr:Uncharacterised protein [Mycobacteroides abscessus subsp. abscessus]